MAKLTGFSKLLITLLILAILFLGGNYLLNNTTFGQNLKDQSAAGTENSSSSKSDDGGLFGKKGDTKKSSSSAGDDDVLKVQLVTWGGYAPGLYFNEGAQANTRSRFYKDYGLKVEFSLENDLINAMNAWIADEYDVIVQTADAFPLYTSAPDINSFGPTAFIQVDWSRGGDAIIVKRGINSMNDLKGKKIALAVPAPSQTFLITALEAANLKYSDVTIIKTSDPLKAAELFRSDDVDAAVVWSPDDIITTSQVPGSKILMNTEQQSHIIGDIMFAKKDFINKNKGKIDAFYEGWMKGVAEIEAEKSNRQKAAKYLAELNQIGVDDALGMMETVKWTSHGDNVNFFGLNRSHQGQTGNDLYSKMSKKFVEIGDADAVAPSWRSVIYTGAIQAAEANLKGAQYGPEKSKNFKPATPSDKIKTPIAIKPITINFPTGVSELSENAKTIIDLQFKDIAKSFANTKIRIEGNTDNVGGTEMNLRLSKTRATAVANYLQKAYGMDPNRFVIVGNGPNKPVVGCESNATNECKAKNRRTEFQILG